MLSTTSLPSSSLTNTLARPESRMYRESVSSPSLMTTAFLGNERATPWGASSRNALSPRLAKGPIARDMASSPFYKAAACPAWDVPSAVDRRAIRCAFSVLAARGHVRPQGVDIIRLEQVAPRRHGVLALRYRGDEALALIAREFAQIGRALRIGHARTVAGGTVSRIHFRTAFDLLRLERVLRRYRVRKGEQEADEDYFLQLGHTARKTHRLPPVDRPAKRYADLVRHQGKRPDRSAGKHLALGF